jgi:RNA polymerase sigma-70 factor (ECF subfamily)
VKPSASPPQLDAATEERLAEDRAWMQQARNGDMAAFERLVTRYSGRVYTLALRMTGSAADAQEIMQETFLSAYQNLKSFRGDSGFGSWVHRIAANFALMRLRHKRVVDDVEGQLKGELEFSDDGKLASFPLSNWGQRADEAALGDELKQAIEQSVSRLPDAYRVVFLLKDVEGLSYEEIAEVVGETVPAVKSRLHRARLNLRQAIDEFYAERKPG